MRVDRARLRQMSAELAADPPCLPLWNHLHLPEDPGPALDAMVWLGNAVNFCYWVGEGEEMWSLKVAGRREVDAMALFGAFRLALDDGADLGDAAFLSVEGPDGPARLFSGGEGTLPLREERVAILQAIGRVLERDFEGRLENAVAAAPRDATGMALFLSRALPSYRDARVMAGVRLPFLKRAQLAAAMLHGRRVALGAPGLEGTERLTLFADYMLPRTLRAEGVIVYVAELARRVDAGEELPPGSPEETEIRVATVAAGQELVEAVRELGGPIDALRLDFLLWQRGFAVDAPHHRTVCTDY